MTENVVVPLLSEQKIAERVKELGTRIKTDYDGRELLVIAILHGALVFAADLVRQIRLPLEMDIVKIASYDGIESTGELHHILGTSLPVEQKHVLVIDDILDTGLTMYTIQQHLLQAGAASVKSCVLLNKPGKHKHHAVVPYIGFDIQDSFVVGYGLDYNGQFRNLGYVGVLDPTVLT